jgi:holliday junction DNA helicase RuvB
MPRRPPIFHDFVGQTEAVNWLRQLGEGAQSREEPFPNALFTGSSGLGKTQLAKCVAWEFGAGFIETRGRLSYDEMVSQLVTIKLHDFFFVDEAHW